MSYKAKAEPASKPGPHYSTFKNDIQAQRLAALQATADEHTDTRSRPVRLMSNACASLSRSASSIFSELLYRMSLACLPCFEIMTAFNIFGGSKKSEAKNGERCLLSRSNSINNSERDLKLSETTASDNVTVKLFALKKVKLLGKCQNSNRPSLKQLAWPLNCHRLPEIFVSFSKLNYIGLGVQLCLRLSNHLVLRTFWVVYLTGFPCIPLFLANELETLFKSQDLE